jgi:hypothetical protein
MINRFEPGMFVRPVIVESNSFYGIVTEINKPENKVYVAWGNGAISQHDPDEIMLEHILNNTSGRRQSLPEELSNKHRTVARSMGAKEWDTNPWAVCHTTVNKDKDPEKYERCVKKVKKQQASRRDIYSSENGTVYRKTVDGIKKK